MNNLFVYERKITRGRIEILADIIFHCQEGLKKTHIMLRAKLGYEQLCYYLPHLINKDLVTQVIVAGTVIYRTTENGREFLNNYYNIMNLISDDNVDNHILSISENGNGCSSSKFPNDITYKSIVSMQEKNQND